MNLRRLSLAILVGMNFTAGAAMAGSPSATTEHDPSTSDGGSSVLANAQRAADHLAAADITDRVKALDVLSACDTAMHPICRVDMGMAYGLLAQDVRLSQDQRASFKANARERLGHAARLGNLEARQMLATLESPNSLVPSPAVAASPDAHLKHNKLRSGSKPDLLKVPVGSTAAHITPQPIMADIEDNGFLRSQSLVQPIRPLAAMLIPNEPHGYSEPVATPLRTVAPAAVAPQAPSAELVELKEQLVSVRLELEEANRTINSLRSLLSAKQEPMFDAADANKRALALALNGDYETAIPMFRRAAEANHPGAINNLAIMNVNGTGLPRDLQQAITLFERAARLGNVESAENVARIYNYGIGRPKDPSRARIWYSKAIELGSREAAIEMAQMNQLLESYGSH